MNFIKNLFLSLKEILIVMLSQYLILIISIILYGINKSYYIGTILLLIFDISFIILKIRKRHFNISFKGRNYFFCITLGLSISIIYNMILYRFNLYSYQSDNISFFLNIFSSGIIGPIFEEVLFRVSFISKLEKWNKDKIIIIFLSSFIFAIFHFNVYSSIIAFIIGIINGYIYVKERNVRKIFLIHISNNIMSSFLFGYNFNILILGTFLLGISLAGFLKIKE